MKLATQDKPFFPDPFEEKLRTVQTMGFDAFEVDGKALLERFHEIRAAIRATQVPISTACGGYRGWIGDFDPERRALAISDISEMLKHAAEISAQGMVVPAAWGMFSKRLPPMVPPRSEEEDRDVLLDSLGKLNRVAQETGTLLYLEPLNRYEDHMLNRLADAVGLIRTGCFTHVKVLADFYHMNIEEASIEQSIREAGDCIGHIHLADNHRYQPGDGHIDFVSGFRALKEIGYNGYLAFECRVTGTPEPDVYRSSAAFVRRCIQQAG